MTDSRSADLLARRNAVVSRGVPLATTSTAASASGARMVDADGRALIDLASGIGVCAAGHCPPTVVEAIRRQAETLMHACFHVSTYEPYVELCERLVALLPHGGPTKAMLVNSGAEAVENAVKIARQATGRSGVICYTGAFHGRTLMGMSLTSKVGYKLGCGPFAPEIYRLPFPVEASADDELARLRDALSTYAAPEDVAAVIMEPVLGEGGFIPVPKAYLEGLREVCTEHGIMLILDEVQTGFGRTGHMGAFQHYGVTPDLSTWAKALGSGLPIAAVLGRSEIMDAARPGTIGGTYGGNPVCCAAALATLDLIESENLCARAVEIGDRARAAFGAVDRGLVREVRGIGAMVGVELTDPNKAKEVTEAALERGVLVIRAGVKGDVVRLLCPLVIEDADLDAALAIICEEIERRST